MESTRSTISIAEVLGSLTLAVDAGTALPPETGLKTLRLAVRLVCAHGASEAMARETFYAALVRHLGCTSASLEESRVGGNDVELRGALLPCDPSNPASIVAQAIRQLARDKPPAARARIVGRFLIKAPPRARKIVASQCEVASRLTARLQLGAGVQAAVDEIEERYDGRGFPNGIAGEDLRLSGRALKLCEIAVLKHRFEGPAAVRKTLERRAGGQLDPALVDTFLRDEERLLDCIRPASVWSAVMAEQPTPPETADPARLRQIALVLADFADLKSPYMLGHSRAVAELVEEAGPTLGVVGKPLETLIVAALLHDLGRVGVPNSIWDKPDALDAGEWEQVRRHPYETERILERCSVLEDAAEVAGSHHERSNGRGYHKRLPPVAQSVSSRLLQAADAFQALREHRAHRAAYSDAEAAAILQDEVEAGQLDAEAVAAVLRAAGHRRLIRKRSRRSGLTGRELEVLRLLARGLRRKDIGGVLHISHRTVQRHEENIYRKIDVNSRAAAALYASEHGLV